VCAEHLPIPYFPVELHEMQELIKERIRCNLS
jgi:hypothetical protein